MFLLNSIEFVVQRGFFVSLKPSLVKGESGKGASSNFKNFLKSFGSNIFKDIRWQINSGSIGTSSFLIFFIEEEIIRIDFTLLTFCKCKRPYCFIIYDYLQSNTYLMSFEAIYGRIFYYTEINRSYSFSDWKWIKFLKIISNFFEITGIA